MRCRTRPSGDILSPVGGDVVGAYVLTDRRWTPLGPGAPVAPHDGDPASGGQTLDVAVMPPSSVAMNFVGRTVMTTRTSLSVTS